MEGSYKAHNLQKELTVQKQYRQTNYICESRKA